MEVAICHSLGITYTELQQQPEEWVQKYLIFLEGKNKAEKDRQEDASRKAK